jgi:hypothetical protein
MVSMLVMYVVDGSDVDSVFDGRGAVDVVVTGKVIVVIVDGVLLVKE